MPGPLFLVPHIASIMGVNFRSILPINRPDRIGIVFQSFGDQRLHRSYQSNFPNVGVKDTGIPNGFPGVGNSELYVDSIYIPL